MKILAPNLVGTRGWPDHSEVYHRLPENFHPNPEKLTQQTLGPRYPESPRLSGNAQDEPGYFCAVDERDRHLASEAQSLNFDLSGVKADSSRRTPMSVCIYDL